MVRGALFSACRCSRNDGRRLPTEGPAIPASGTISVVSALMLWLPELVGLIELSGLGALCSGRSQHFRRSPTGPWGNGSPTDSGSVSPGSNPGGPARGWVCDSPPRVVPRLPREDLVVDLVVADGLLGLALGHRRAHLRGRGLVGVDVVHRVPEREPDEQPRAPVRHPVAAPEPLARLQHRADGRRGLLRRRLQLVDHLERPLGPCDPRVHGALLPPAPRRAAWSRSGPRGRARSRIIRNRRPLVNLAGAATRLRGGQVRPSARPMLVRWIG